MNAKHSSRRALAVAVLGTMPLLFWADTGLGLAAGWRPFGAVEHGMLLLAGALSLCFLALLSSSVRNAALRHGRELFLLAAACLLGWALLECGAARLHRALRPEKPFHTRGPFLREIFHPVPEFLPGIQGPTRYTTDAAGIRAPEAPRPDTQRRILCVGGSSTECVYLDDAKTWPALLMQQLNKQGVHAWVGNVGISGFDTREHLRFLESSPLLNGVDSVVAQIGINDLWRFLAREEQQTRFDRFREGAGASEPPPARAAPFRTPLWTTSRVIQLWHDLRQSPPRPELVEGPGGGEYRIRREKRAAARQVEALPDLTPGLEGYRGRIAAMIRCAQARGIKIVFTTQPVLWRGDLPPELAQRCWFGWLENGEYLSLRALREAMDAYNAALQGVCRESSVPCADLSAMNGCGEFFYDDCHFTEAGAAEAARRIAELMTPRR